MIKALILLCLALHVSLASTIPLSDEHLAYLREKRTISMCVDPEWEPFEKINDKKEHEGIAADIIRLIAQRLDITIKLLPTSTWQESVKKSQNYECDILSLVNQTPKRDQWLLYTAPIIEDPNVLIARSEHAYIEDIAGLKKYSIALLKDTAILERFQKDYPNFKIIPVITEEEPFRLVEEKKADFKVKKILFFDGISSHHQRAQCQICFFFFHQSKGFFFCNDRDNFKIWIIFLKTLQYSRIF